MNVNYESNLALYTMCIILTSNYSKYQMHIKRLKHVGILYVMYDFWSFNVQLLVIVIIYKNYNLSHGCHGYQILNLSCFNYCKYSCHYGKYLLLISTITQYILQANKPTPITDTALLPQKLASMKV